MKKQIIHATIMQNSKVMAILYFIIIALFAFPFGIFAMIAGHTEFWIFFLLPFFYMIAGFIMTAFVTWMYNLVASTFGGLEFTFKDSDSSSVE